MPSPIQFPHLRARAADPLTMIRYSLSWQDPPIGRETRHLLLVLLALVGEDGSCAPSIAWLTVRVGAAPDVIRAMLDELIAKGLMEVQHRMAGTVFTFRRLSVAAQMWAAELYGEPGRDEVQDIDPADYDEPRRPA